MKPKLILLVISVSHASINLNEKLLKWSYTSPTGPTVQMWHVYGLVVKSKCCSRSGLFRILESFLNTYRNIQFKVHAVIQLRLCHWPIIHWLYYSQNVIILISLFSLPRLVSSPPATMSITALYRVVVVVALIGAATSMVRRVTVEFKNDCTDHRLTNPRYLPFILFIIQNCFNLALKGNPG